MNPNQRYKTTDTALLSQQEGFCLTLKTCILAFISVILGHHMQINGQHAIEASRECWNWMEHVVRDNMNVF